MISRRILVFGCLFMGLTALDPQKSSADETVEGWAVIEAAREYSAGYKGVGVVIYMGKDVDYTQDQLGEAFVKAFNNLETDARYFADDLGRNITSISFYLDEADVIGPFNFSDAAGKIPEIAEKHRIANLHPYTSAEE